MLYPSLFTDSEFNASNLLFFVFVWWIEVIGGPRCGYTEPLAGVENSLYFMIT